jgi:ribonuclease-3
MGEGDGFSKKEAEQNAAKEALLKLEEIVWVKAIT